MMSGIQKKKPKYPSMDGEYRRNYRRMLYHRKKMEKKEQEEKERERKRKRAESARRRYAKKKAIEKRRRTAQQKLQNGAVVCEDLKGHAEMISDAVSKDTNGKISSASSMAVEVSKERAPSRGKPRSSAAATTKKRTREKDHPTTKIILRYTV